MALEGEGSNCFGITQLVGQKKAIINSAKKNIYLGIKRNKVYKTGELRYSMTITNSPIVAQPFIIVILSGANRPFHLHAPVLETGTTIIPLGVLDIKKTISYSERALTKIKDYKRKGNLFNCQVF